MIHLAAIDLKREKINTLLIPVCEDQSIHTDSAILALAESALGHEEFQGKQDQEIILYNPPGLSVDRAVFRGLGKAEKLDAEGLRKMAGKSLKRCAKMGVARLWVAVPHAVGLSLDASCLLTALLEGAVLGNHVFDRYKQEKETKPLARIDFLVPAEHVRRFQKLAAQIETVCRGTILAREWVNMPSNEKTPEQFARLITAAAKKSGLSARVFTGRAAAQKIPAPPVPSARQPEQPAMVVHKPRGGTSCWWARVTLARGSLNIKTGPSLAT
jgi:leucyl aminopeptidase